MTYITDKNREKLDPLVDALTNEVMHLQRDADGALNYILTRLLDNLHVPSYHNFVRVLGCLEAVKQEYYRRRVAPYEDTMRDKLGEVFKKQ